MCVSSRVGRLRSHIPFGVVKNKINKKKKKGSSRLEEKEMVKDKGIISHYKVHRTVAAQKEEINSSVERESGRASQRRWHWAL